MSRRHSAVKRVVLPDAKYNDQVVAKFINNVMEQGKKGRCGKNRLFRFRHYGSEV